MVSQQNVTGLFMGYGIIHLTATNVVIGQHVTAYDMIPGLAHDSYIRGVIPSVLVRQQHVARFTWYPSASNAFSIISQ